MTESNDISRIELNRSVCINQEARVDILIEKWQTQGTLKTWEYDTIEEYVCLCGNRVEKQNMKCS